MLAVGIIGCLLGFVLVIFLSYKNFSPFIASVIGALFVIIVTGSPLAETLTGVYFPKLASFVSGYWGIFLFGSILAKIYADSGAALSIAEGIMRLLVREGRSEKTKQIMALVVSMLMTGVLGLGGIITSVAVIIAYPLSLAVLEQANIPKRFSFAALALGAYTWCCVMPGSPQVTNIIPSNYLGTTGMALLVPGIIGVIVWVVLALAVLNLMVSKAKKNGEGFAYGATDTKYDTSEAKPNVWIALIPLVLIFALFNAAKLDINLCLLLSVILSLVLFWNFLKRTEGNQKPGIQKTLNAGAVNALGPVCTVGAMVGFANCVTVTEAFTSMTDILFSLPLPPVLMVVIFCGIIAALTGGSATGFAVSLPILIPVMVEQMGVSPDMIHRVGLFSGTAISMMPYSGVILMFLPMSGLKLKDIYQPVLYCCVICGLISTVVVGLLASLGL